MIFFLKWFQQFLNIGHVHYGVIIRSSSAFDENYICSCYIKNPLLNGLKWLYYFAISILWILLIKSDLELPELKNHINLECITMLYHTLIKALKLSGSAVYATVTPKFCSDTDQNDTYVQTPGIKLVYSSQSDTCGMYVSSFTLFFCLNLLQKSLTDSHRITCL